MMNENNERKAASFGSYEGCTMNMEQFAALVKFVHEKYVLQSQDDDDQKMPALQYDEALARSLHQQDLPAQGSSQDEAIAQSLQQLELEWNNGQVLYSENTEDDAILAATLYEDDQRKNDEEYAMQQSLDGRAWLCINQVLDLDGRLSTSSAGLTTVSVDDMVFLCKNFMQCAHDFESNGWPSNVILAYHYTRSACMDDIRQDGLMTHEDRRRTYSSNTARGRKSYFGEGIYTATNPFAFSHFGDCGLLVAVLLGNTARVTCRNRTTTVSNLGGVINTVIGNKNLFELPANGDISDETKFTDELVLQKSSQCLPLMRFDKSLVDTEQGRDAVWKYHQELQILIDRVFNGGVTTELKRILPRPATASSHPLTHSLPVARVIGAHLVTASSHLPTHSLPVARPVTASSPPGWSGASPVTAASRPSWFGAAHRNRPTLQPSEVLAYTAPKSILKSIPIDAFENGNRDSQEACAICMDYLCNNTDTVLRLRQCSHDFHAKCIKESLRNFPLCPVCRAVIRKPHGTCPSGTMAITFLPQITCSGFESSSNGSTMLTYAMPRGTQQAYHENPGTPFQGRREVAYLPNCPKGKKLLERLKYAWIHGLTFTVGTSMTTGRQNCIVWASIHHKTSPSGGSHGFPDPSFFDNCNRELDSLGVPK